MPRESTSRSSEVSPSSSYQTTCFTIGNSVLHSLVPFRPQRKPNGAEEVTNNQANFFEQQDTSLTRLNERVSLSVWKIKAHMVQVFQHDEGLKQELITVTYKSIAEKACDFLDAATHDHNEVIFKVLKLCYLPVVCMQLGSADLDE